MGSKPNVISYQWVDEEVYLIPAVLQTETDKLKGQFEQIQGMETYLEVA